MTGTPRNPSENFVPRSTPSRISQRASPRPTGRKLSLEPENSAPTSPPKRAYNAERASTIGVVGKDIDPDELTRAVHAVAEGHALLSARTVRRLVDDLPPRCPPGMPLPPERDELTDRDRELVVLEAAGLTTAEIADRLVISPVTTETRVGRAMFKLGAHDRSQLVVIAYQTALVRLRAAASAATARWRSNIS